MVNLDYFCCWGSVNMHKQTIYSHIELREIQWSECFMENNVWKIKISSSFNWLHKKKKQALTGSLSAFLAT